MVKAEEMDKRRDNMPLQGGGTGPNICRVPFGCAYVLE